MTLIHDLSKILACPVCKKSVIPSSDGCWLVCAFCRLRYPIREGIPVLLVEEAEKAVQCEE